MCGIGTVHPLESICNSWVHFNTLSQADILRAVLQQVKTNSGSKAAILILIWSGIEKNLQKVLCFLKNSESNKYL